METDSLIITDTLSIPETELSFRFSTSGGPGGQHANRAATRVTVRFDVAGSTSLTDADRSQLMENLKTQMDQHGILSITVQETRSQYQNRKLALDRLQSILAEALTSPTERKATRPSRSSREKRLTKKRHRSQEKKARRGTWEEG